VRLVRGVFTEVVEADLQPVGEQRPRRRIGVRRRG
jgi:hypothetical protein